jgi:hypothetical protein
VLKQGKVQTVARAVVAWQRHPDQSVRDFHQERPVAQQTLDFRAKQQT